jgi:hypothetical protein
MTFLDLETRLLERMNNLVRQGHTSQRRLAHLTGYTQPHIHNVLKRVRRLQPDLADRLLRAGELGLEDLLYRSGEKMQARGAPLWHGALGPCHAFPQPGETGESRLFTATFLDRFHEPVLLRAASEEDSMAPLIKPGDLVLIDRAEGARPRPTFAGIWALSLDGQGALCRCQPVGGALVLISDNSRSLVSLPDHVALARRNILDIVRGRAVWVGRELDLL